MTQVTTNFKQPTAAKKALPRIAYASKKRRAEAPARRALVEAVIARQNGVCAAVGLVPEVRCWGALEVDEIVGRGVYPGGHLDEANCIAQCHAHHAWKGREPAEAERRGLRRTSASRRVS